MALLNAVDDALDGFRVQRQYIGYPPGWGGCQKLPLQQGNPVNVMEITRVTLNCQYNFARTQGTFAIYP